ncbi:MAG: hypothetical protein PQJ59_04295 [Spirochaetales bacterium]|nr:hypothetical protein [Spirochaetales bacterium]
MEARVATIVKEIIRSGTESEKRHLVDGDSKDVSFSYDNNNYTVVSKLPKGILTVKIPR